ncbi:hypothetical protein D3C80_2229100 [compost metagenome]
MQFLRNQKKNALRIGEWKLKLWKISFFEFQSLKVSVVMRKLVVILSTVEGLF